MPDSGMTAAVRVDEPNARRATRCYGRAPRTCTSRGRHRVTGPPRHQLHANQSWPSCRRHDRPSVSALRYRTGAASKMHLCARDLCASRSWSLDRLEGGDARVGGGSARAPPHVTRPAPPGNRRDRSDRPPGAHSPCSARAAAARAFLLAPLARRESGAGRPSAWGPARCAFALTRSRVLPAVLRASLSLLRRLG